MKEKRKVRSEEEIVEALEIITAFLKLEGPIHPLSLLALLHVQCVLQWALHFTREDARAQGPLGTLDLESECGQKVCQVLPLNLESILDFLKEVTERVERGESITLVQKQLRESIGSDWTPEQN